MDPISLDQFSERLNNLEQISAQCVSVQDRLFIEVLVGLLRRPAEPNVAGGCETGADFRSIATRRPTRDNSGKWCPLQG